MSKLITGGSGQIGAALAHILVERGEDVVVFDVYRSTRLSDIQDKLKFVRGDVGTWPEVLNVIKDYNITQIYHMGAILTSETEANHYAGFQANVVGTFNVLEAARFLGIERVVFTSSIGTFGPVADKALTDATLQRPNTFYGVAKLYGEGLGRWYNRKFGLDFRGVRYPSVVGDVATPGHWDAPMILSAIEGKPHHCNIPRDVPTAMIYYRDAARAADMLMQAPATSIKMMNYNVGAVPAATPAQVEVEIKKHIPDAVITFPQAAERVNLNLGRAWDDSYARAEWGWRPEYATLEQIVAALIKERMENKALNDR